VWLCVGIFSVTLSSRIAPAQAPKPKEPQKTGVQKKSPPAAEAPPIQRWMSVSVVQIKPEMINEWIDLNKTVVIPALKKAGLKQREAWQTAQFGQAFEYILVTPIDSFAQYDGEPLIRKGLGEEGYNAYLEKARRIVASVRTYAELVRPDLSHTGKTNGPPKFAVVTSVSIAPGRAQEFESLIRTEVVPAVKKTEISGYFVSQTGFGGDVNLYTTVALYASFAEIGKGSYVVRGMGQAAYDRFIRKTTGIVVRLERIVARYNPELSFGG
jgi:hypothetical protein